MIETISSFSNERIKLLRQLQKSRKQRYESGLFLLEGGRMVEDALKSGIQPRAVLLSGEWEAEADRFSEYGPVWLISKEIAASLSDTQSPQGIFLLVPMPQRSEDYTGERQLLLCSLQDPGNVGTIVRTAEALGLDRLILTADCPDLFSPKLLRATMGGVLRLPITVAESAAVALTALHDAGVKCIATTLSQQAVPLPSADLSGPVCLVVGNEGGGLPEAVVAGCEGEVIIPMKGRAESLNAAMAAGILLWELLGKER